METQTKSANLKQVALHELRAFLMISLYLFLFLGVFAIYRRLLMDQYKLNYVRMGYVAIEAMVLAKVIMIGNWLRLGERARRGPLIFATLGRTLAFTLFAMVFGVLERGVMGLFDGKNLEAIGREIVDQDRYEILGRLLVTFFTFIPFFAIWEIGNVVGPDKLRGLFFRSRAAVAP
jgi:hypothetical protein